MTETTEPDDVARLMRAVIYVRVSSSQQADKDYDPEGFSIPAQREACVRKAASLGAEVAEEFVDRGESARTANRPGLRALLTRLEQRDIDYVIVHKVDRLARNRADDVAIVMQLRSHGAQLVSATENIDETPSGLLLHGIMSSIAEFYSQNLATEIKKGSTQKAKKGGTPFKAPIGYLNTRDFVDGREIRTITLDPDRAPLIKLAFELYATGDYSTIELAAILEAQGLRSRGTRKCPPKPLGFNRIAQLLHNPYYAGSFTYGGKHYSGRHEPLVDEETFDKVQQILKAQRQSGERSWKHHNYLRGTLYCPCGRRLLYSRNRGHRGDIYEYYVCAGKHVRTCTQPYHRAADVEGAVEQLYAEVELTGEQRDKVRELLETYLAEFEKIADREIRRARSTLERLDNQERKLLAAHYADRISDYIYNEEQERIRRERIAATSQLQQHQGDTDTVRRTLELALELAADTEHVYRNAKPNERRLLNQAFFEAIEVDGDEIASHTLQPPFRQIKAASKQPRLQQPSSTARKGGTPARSRKGGGSYEQLLVEEARLERAAAVLVRHAALAAAPDRLDDGHAHVAGLVLDRVDHGLDPLPHDYRLDLDHSQPPLDHKKSPATAQVARHHRLHGTPSLANRCVERSRGSGHWLG